jgi:hypothetical protein
MTMSELIAGSQDLITSDKVQTMSDTIFASEKRGKGAQTQYQIERDWNYWCSMQTPESQRLYVIIWSASTPHIPNGAYYVMRTTFKQYFDYSEDRPKQNNKGVDIPDTKLGFV